MSYKYLEHVSIADVTFVAEGRTLDEMFGSAGLAVTNTMVKDIKSVKPKVKKKITLKSDNVEKLLHSFLQEFVYWKDKSLLLFSKVDVRIKEPSKAEKNYTLSAVVTGDKLDMRKHELLVDVKAVTWHLFKVEKKKKWSCHVVLDV